jgi:hypothetical protein
MAAVNDKVFNFKLVTGYSAETSGGLLLCIPADKAPLFIKVITVPLFVTAFWVVRLLNGVGGWLQQDMAALEGEKAWIVGDVVAGGGRKASINAAPTIIEV